VHPPSAPPTPMESQLSCSFALAHRRARSPFSRAPSFSTRPSLGSGRQQEPQECFCPPRLVALRAHARLPPGAPSFCGSSPRGGELTAEGRGRSKASSACCVSLAWRTIATTPAHHARPRNSPVPCSCAQSVHVPTKPLDLLWRVALVLLSRRILPTHTAANLLTSSSFCSTNL